MQPAADDRRCRPRRGLQQPRSRGASGGGARACQHLGQATPLIFTGLATALAFRARLWNIGAEGQVFAGAMFAYWCTHALGDVPASLQIPVIVLTAMLGGALFGGFAGVLKTHFQVDEVISTVMLNYIIAFGLSVLLLNGPWSEEGGFLSRPRRSLNRPSCRSSSRRPSCISGSSWRCLPPSASTSC
ncbi:MAG: ABC transporter permease [Rhizobiales bacterium]|nr:ABC transporter permease [Hyphomicrobiales bacterium]